MLVTKHLAPESPVVHPPDESNMLLPIGETTGEWNVPMVRLVPDSRRNGGRCYPAHPRSWPGQRKLPAKSE